MKIVALIARLLLAFMFVMAGANGLFHFGKMPPMTPVAAAFSEILISTHYMSVVACVQLIGGLLLLVNRFVPLGLTLLGPVIVNIFLFHALMDPHGIVPGLVAAVLWAIIFWSRKQAFAAILGA